MAAMRSDNLNITKAPPLRGFCFPAIRQGYSRDALHQYPCRIVVLQTKPESLGTRRGFVVSAIRSGLLGRDVLHDTLKPMRESPEPDCICRSLVITSGFHPEDTGSIPVRCSNPSTLGPLRLPPSLLPLVLLPALSGFFIEHAQTLGNHPRRALLINQPAGSGPLFPFTHSAIRHQRR